MIYSGFKVIEAWTHMLKGLFIICDMWLVSIYFCIESWRVHMWGIKCTLFWNTWFHALWGVHDFTNSLYINYRICQSMDYVYIFMRLMILVCLPGLVGLLSLGLILLFYVTNNNSCVLWSLIVSLKHIILHTRWCYILALHQINWMNWFAGGNLI